MIQFSSRCKNLQASPIRQILSVIDQPGMVSFAGGLPAAETFYTPDLANLPNSYLQYGPSEGEWELRELICKELHTTGLHCQPEQILILSGSQQGIDLVAKLFVDPGTLIAVESPTYLAALQVFRFFGAEFTLLSSLGHETDYAKTPAFAYTIPTFQNPTGYCYSKEERLALGDTCSKLAIPLFEDDPYRDLVYEKCDRQPICSTLNACSWIYQSSFSKTFAPGLRLGYLACSSDLLVPLTRLKQAADLHSNRISQWLILQQLKDPNYASIKSELAKMYLQKRDAFAVLLVKHLGKLATWDIPKGGLFFWLKLNHQIDTKNLLAQAIKHNVAFMPGESFFPLAVDGEQPSFMRLNFSHANKHEANAGLAQLAQLIQSMY